MDQQVRRWETSTRYYECRVYEDLFGEPILVAVNGGKGSRLGMSRVVASDAAAIEAAMARIAAARLRHGYREIVLNAGPCRPEPDLFQAPVVAQADKRIRHHQIRRGHRKRRPVVIDD